MKMTRKEFRDYLYRTDRSNPAPTIEHNKTETQKLVSAAYFAFHASRIARHKDNPVLCRNKENLPEPKKQGILAKINSMLGGIN